MWSLHHVTSDLQKTDFQLLWFCVAPPGGPVSADWASPWRVRPSPRCRARTTRTAAAAWSTFPSRPASTTSTSPTAASTFLVRARPTDVSSFAGSEIRSVEPGHKLLTELLCSLKWEFRTLLAVQTDCCRSSAQPRQHRNPLLINNRRVHKSCEVLCTFISPKERRFHPNTKSDLLSFPAINSRGSSVDVENMS